MEKRKTKVQSWYLDLSMVRKYWAGAKRAYHHTAPVSMIYALYEALRLIHEEGLEARFQRHFCNHELLRDGLLDFALQLLKRRRHQRPQLLGLDGFKQRLCLSRGHADLADKLIHVGNSIPTRTVVLPERRSMPSLSRFTCAVTSTHLRGQGRPPAAQLPLPYSYL